MSSKSIAVASIVAATALVNGTSRAQQRVPNMASTPIHLASAYRSADAKIHNEDAGLEPRLRRQVVDYPTRVAPGTIIVDTPHTYLYYVLGNGKAIRYGIGVGREGFTWSGVNLVSRKAEWPDWYPPAKMVDRQPYLPRIIAGGPGNPLGARALYIGDTEYRIHGTNDPTTIGKHVSSGCIRLANDDVIDLYRRASVGAKVIVLPDIAEETTRIASNRTPVSRLRMSSNNFSLKGIY